MVEKVVAGAQIQFRPGPEWAWHGWDGIVRLRVADHGYAIDAAPVSLSSDVLAHVPDLAGRAYITPTYSSKPGISGQATITVEESTLSRITRLQGRPVVIASTTGRFTIVMTQPAQAAGAPPPTDNVLLKSGTWHVMEPGQHRVRSE